MKVLKDVAENCDRKLCTCTSHNDYSEKMFERFAISDTVDEIEDEPFIPAGIDMSLVINEDKEDD